MAKILIIEDEEDMRFILADNLQAEGYDVEGVATGREGVARAESDEFALIILDLMLPDINGLEVCKAVRARDASTPIIILTAKGSETDKVVGLEVGADDYVTKPFGMPEFLARVKAAIRRAGGLSAQSLTECAIGDLKVDFPARELTREGRSESLTRYETELLRFLAQHRGAPVSRARILQAIWRTEPTTETRTVDNCIKRLRAKIEPVPARPRHILTVHGLGYKLA
jgi:DNA-binding response OmpR family regulator